ncbi:Clavaminate synthase-like protein [Porphyridium purpureum]|uniref:Clavaminate synthase-like protein n=1 Tax=Porphyridium purpureum TaxID=35688 RepID=A0A5J4Z6Q0_PORPP|nr:Clavaminate synthase-like protein [Porphyridium purpureum]|eukprot:POR7947..scf295_1
MKDDFLWKQAVIPEARAIALGTGPDAAFTFPLVLMPEKEFEKASLEQVLSNVHARRDELEEQLSKHGAILFRAFPGVTSANAFDEFVRAGLGIRNFPYVGGNAVRKKVVADRVFTTNESPPDRLIPFHHELAQTSNYPSRILFFCDLPAAQGGETPIANSVETCALIAEKFPDFLKALEQFGVVYTRVMTEHDRAESAIGRGWKSTFNVDSKEQLEALLASKGEQCEWLRDGAAEAGAGLMRHCSPVLPAVKTLKDGRRVFFNQVIAAYTGWQDEFNDPATCVRLGDDTRSALDPEAMQFCIDILRECQVAFPWQEGDVLYIHNELVMHARNTFSGPRRIFAALGV